MLCKSIGNEFILWYSICLGAGEDFFIQPRSGRWAFFLTSPSFLFLREGDSFHQKEAAYFPRYHGTGSYPIWTDEKKTTENIIYYRGRWIFQRLLPCSKSLLLEIPLLSISNFLSSKMTTSLLVKAMAI